MDSDVVNPFSPKGFFVDEYNHMAPERAKSVTSSFWEGGGGRGCRDKVTTTRSRQCDPVVRALALRSGDPRFQTGPGHWLNLFLIVPGSTSQLHV